MLLFCYAIMLIRFSYTFLLRHDNAVLPYFMLPLCFFFEKLLLSRHSFTLTS